MNAEQAWELAKWQLNQEMLRGCFDPWVKDTRLVSYLDGRFVVEAKSEFAREWLTQRLTSTVVRKLAGMMNREVDVVFVGPQVVQMAQMKKEEKDLQPDLF